METTPPGPPSGRADWREYWSRLRRQKDQILNIRAAAARERTGFERALVAVARVLAHPLFFASEAVFHAAWVGLNLLLPEAARWDPYPFPLLTGLASAQALFIGLLILMYEDHSARVAEVREETELNVSLHTERETTKLLRMMSEVHLALGIRSDEIDEELAEMAQPLDPDRLREVTESQIEKADRDVPGVPSGGAS